MVGAGDLMPNMKDLSPEEVRAHLEHSDEYEAQFLAHFKREEQARKSVTPGEAAKRHLQEVVLDECGTVRFRENVLVTNLLATPGKQRGDPREPWMVQQLRRLLDEEKGNGLVRWLATFGPMDMNEIAQEDFSQRDREEFAMLVGYSVSGVGVLSYFSDAMWERANAESERLLEQREKFPNEKPNN